MRVRPAPVLCRRSSFVVVVGGARTAMRVTTDASSSLKVRSRHGRLRRTNAPNAPPLFFSSKNISATRDRTRDLQIFSLALSQLSYRGKSIWNLDRRSTQCWRWFFANQHYYKQSKRFAAQSDFNFPAPHAAGCVLPWCDALASFSSLFRLAGPHRGSAVRGFPVSRACLLADAQHARKVGLSRSSIPAQSPLANWPSAPGAPRTRNLGGARSRLARAVLSAWWRMSRRSCAILRARRLGPRTTGLLRWGSPTRQQRHHTQALPRPPPAGQAAASSCTGRAAHRVIYPIRIWQFEKKHVQNPSAKCFSRDESASALLVSLALVFVATGRSVLGRMCAPASCVFCALSLMANSLVRLWSACGLRALCFWLFWCGAWV